jgi:hypothetical protein
MDPRTISYKLAGRQSFYIWWEKNEKFVQKTSTEWETKYLWISIVPCWQKLSELLSLKALSTLFLLFIWMRKRLFTDELHSASIKSFFVNTISTSLLLSLAQQRVFKPWLRCGQDSAAASQSKQRSRGNKDHWKHLELLVTLSLSTTRVFF